MVLAGPEAGRHECLWLVVAALPLVAATLVLHIGLPLWDYIDLVPDLPCLAGGWPVFVRILEGA